MTTPTRRTRQRDVLENSLRSAGRPVSAQELWVEAQRETPRLGLATVYRFLADLEGGGRLKKLEIAGEPPRFELADSPHHHHFFCRSCHTIYPLPGCVEGLRRMAPRNFHVEDHDIVLYGQCESCAEQPIAGTESVRTRR